MSINDTASNESSRPAPGGPSVASRVTTLLELVAQRSESIGPREAERLTGIDRSAASRIFRQLEAQDWVSVDERGSYTCGPKMFAIAASVRQRDSQWMAAEPMLRRLTRAHNETTYLAVREGLQVVFKEKVDCDQPIRYVLELNRPFPLTTGAAGRAILSALPDELIRQVIDSGLTAHTPMSVTDPSAYVEMIHADRDRGYIYSQSGWVADGAGVASPFFDAGNECRGALTVSAPAARLHGDRAETLGTEVRSAARQLSRRLGHTGPDWGTAAQD